MRAPRVLSCSLLLLCACPASSDGPDLSRDDAGIREDTNAQEGSQDAAALARDSAVERAPDAGEHDAGAHGPALADAGAHADAAVLQDAGPRDAGGSDAGSVDDGGTDAGELGPAPGFGAISGPCGVLDAELTSPAPALFENHLDFGSDPYDDTDYAQLSEGGREIIDDGNAGGSSLLSEVFSFELLARCEGATLLKTETEVVYQNPAGKITDLLVEIDGLTVGVSVTRAVVFPFDAPYSVERARELLEKKLKGVLDSSANVSPEDAWVKQILYVIAYGDEHAAALRTAYAQIDASRKADTIVMVSTSDGQDAFLY